MEQLKDREVFVVNTKKLQLSSKEICITGNGQTDNSPELEYKRFLIAKLFRKVKVEISRQALEAFRNILNLYLITGEVKNIWQMASQKMAFMLYDKLNNRYYKKHEKTVKLNFDISEAAFIFDVADEMIDSGLGDYEDNVMKDILWQINAQIA